MALLFTYSEQLRAECIAYFKQKCGVEISDDQANEYLDSLATFFELLSQPTA